MSLSVICSMSMYVREMREGGREEKERDEREREREREEGKREMRRMTRLNKNYY